MTELTDLALHPLNRGFDWPDHEGPFTTVTREQAAAFDGQGFFVLDDVFTPAELAPVVAELDRREQRSEERLSELDGERFGIAEAGAITFTPNLAHRCPVLADLTRHATLLGLCGDLLGPDVDLYWDQAVYKKPQKPRRFPWHQDNGYAYVEPQLYLTCWIALTEATTDNGCPRVAPGLHRLGTLEHHYVEPLGWQIFDDPPAEVAAPVGAGGIVVFSSLTPHLTGPNLTEDVRKAYIVQYCATGSELVEQRPGGLVERRPVAAGSHVYPVLRAGDPVAG